MPSKSTLQRCASTCRHDKVGLMLYTLRDECERDFEGTLRAVADVGYDGVELFDLHGHAAAEVRRGSTSSGSGRRAARGARRDRGGPARARGGARGARLRPARPQLDRAAGDRRRRAGRRRDDRRRRAAACTTPACASASTTTGPSSSASRAASVLDSLLALPADDLWLELDLGWAWEAGRRSGRAARARARPLPARPRQGLSRPRQPGSSAPSATARSATTACCRRRSPPASSG